MTKVFSDVSAALEEADYLATSENRPYVLIVHGSDVKVVCLEDVDCINDRILEIVRPEGTRRLA